MARSGTRKNVGSAFVFSFFLSASFSQGAKGDTAATPFTTLYRQYIAAIGSASGLYNGAEYVGSYPQTEGTPFWNSHDFEKGTISYEGVVYHDIPLAFDLVKNEVVIKGFQQLAISLYAPRIDFFLLAGHRFEHPPAGNDTIFKNIPPDALYDILYNRTVSLYAKRAKSVEPSFHAESPYLFVSHTDYFLLKDNGYYPVSGKKELLNLFKADATALTAFWKKNKVNFKINAEGAILQTISYWEDSKNLK